MLFQYVPIPIILIGHFWTDCGWSAGEDRLAFVFGAGPWHPGRHLRALVRIFSSCYACTHFLRYLTSFLAFLISLPSLPSPCSLLLALFSLESSMVCPSSRMAFSDLWSVSNKWHRVSSCRAELTCQIWTGRSPSAWQIHFICRKKSPVKPLVLEDRVGQGKQMMGVVKLFLQRSVATEPHFSTPRLWEYTPENNIKAHLLETLLVYMEIP